MRTLTTLALLLPLLGCKDNSDDTGCNVIWFEDGDGDGVGSEDVTSTACAQPEGYVAETGDCDDADPTTYPGAAEACDQADNDCNGEVDDGVTGTQYADADGDGFGDPDSSIEGCGASGYVGNADDCDDTAEAVNPDAEEICDGVDNDCDGTPDGADATDAQDWYADLDGDGFGDPENVARACAAPSGYTADDTDCNDAYDLQHPGAAEVCNDGVVNDCDGSEADARAQCVLQAAIDLSDANAKRLGERRDHEAGGAMAGAGDADGDGLDDMLIGAAGHDGAGLRTGAAYLVLDGRATGDLSDAAARMLGEASDDEAGAAVSGAPDVLGDGAPAFLVGAPGESTVADGAGAVYLVSGTTRGDLSLSSSTAAKLTGWAAGDQLGRAVVGVDDLTGDGLADLVLGAPGNDDNGSDAGAVYVFSGPQSGEVNVRDADIKMTGATSNQLAGWALDRAGDFNGDGTPDLIVGAYQAFGGANRSGAAAVIAGPLSASFSISDAQALLLGQNGDDYAGWSVAGLGDTDGDGLDDVLVGAPRVGNGNNGAVYLVLGGSSGTIFLNNADAKFDGERRDDLAGTAVVGPGDVDVDGNADLMIGAPGSSSTGRAYLFLGPVSGTVDVTEADSILTGESADDSAGATLGAPGDLDGDGAMDLLIGAIGDDDGGDEAGAVYVVLGPGI
ncbi:MAG: FG-GAP repeat protein [Alphaproteobacteria bacterium]|nr:FG-GAP repeat protein [Alphaproteobacteria bacterium]